MELYLQIGGKYHKIDTDNNFQVKMTYEMKKHSKPNAILNNFSKSVNIIGNNNNNKLFNLLYKLEFYNESPLNTINPNKKISFLLYDNGIKIEEGYAVINNISVTNSNNIIYKLTLYGNLGDLMYKLNYDNDNNKLSLNDLVYNFAKPSNYIGLKWNLDNKPSFKSDLEYLDSDTENDNILFNYNSWFVDNAWDALKYPNDYIDNNVCKVFVPILAYSGYYDNFDNNKVLFCAADYNEGLNKITLPYQIVDEKTGQITNSISYADNWCLLEYSRDMDKFELRDIRSHYMPLGIRCSSVYNSIKEYAKNKGYTINDNYIQGTEEYNLLNNSILSLGTLDWSKIASNAKTFNYDNKLLDLSLDWIYGQPKVLKSFDETNLNVIVNINKNDTKTEYNTNTIIYDITDDLTEFDNLYFNANLTVNHQVYSPTCVVVGGKNEENNTYAHELFNFEQDPISENTTKNDFLVQNNGFDPYNFNLSDDINKTVCRPTSYDDFSDMGAYYNYVGKRAWYQGTFVKIEYLDSSNNVIGLNVDIQGTAPGTNKTNWKLPNAQKYDKFYDRYNDLDTAGERKVSVFDILNTNVEGTNETNKDWLRMLITQQVLSDGQLLNDNELAMLGLSTSRNTNNLLVLNSRLISFSKNLPNMFGLVFTVVEPEKTNEYEKNDPDSINKLPYKTKYYKISNKTSTAQGQSVYISPYDYETRKLELMARLSPRVKNLMNYMYAPRTAYIRNESFVANMPISFLAQNSAAKIDISRIKKIRMTTYNFSCPVYFYIPFEDLSGNKWQISLDGKSNGIETTRIYDTTTIYDYVRNNTIYTDRFKLNKDYNVEGQKYDYESQMIRYPSSVVLEKPDLQKELITFKDNNLELNDFSYEDLKTKDLYLNESDEIYPRDLGEIAVKTLNVDPMDMNVQDIKNSDIYPGGVTSWKFNSSYHYGIDYYYNYNPIVGKGVHKTEANIIYNIIKMAEQQDTFWYVYQLTGIYKPGIDLYVVSKQQYPYYKEYYNYILGKTHSQITNINISNSRVPKEHHVYKKDLLGNTLSPYEFLRSMIDCLNLKIYFKDKTLTLYTSKQYGYNAFVDLLDRSNVVDISKKVDWSSVDIKPYYCEYNNYNYSLDIPESNYANFLYTKLNNEKINEYVYNTKLYTNNKDYKYTDKCIFKCVLEYKLKSNMFTQFNAPQILVNDFKNDYLRQLIPNDIKCSLMSPIGGINSIDYNGIYNRYIDIHSYNDNSYRLCMFDNSNNYVEDSKHSILFFNGFNPVESLPAGSSTDLANEYNLRNQYILSDNIDYMFNFNENPVHLALNPLESHIFTKGGMLSGSNSDKLYCKRLTELPIFNAYTLSGQKPINFSFTNNTIVHMDNDTYYNVENNLYSMFYDEYNKSYLNGNNKLFKCKVNMLFTGAEIFRKLYIIDGFTFILNKVTDVDFFSNYVSCEFIQVFPNKKVIEDDFG